MGKSNAGRKPYDTILKFKIMVLQSLHNLSDDRTEYLIRDRISFMRFLDLELEDPGSLAGWGEGFQSVRPSPAVILSSLFPIGCGAGE